MRDSDTKIICHCQLLYGYGQNKFSNGYVNQCQGRDSKLITTGENDVKGEFQFYGVPDRIHILLF